MITLQGMVSPAQTQLQEVIVAQLQLMLATNEVWAMAILDTSKPLPEQVQVDVSPDMQSLLTEFSDIFDTPTTLPPRRALDHAISLEVDARLVNSCLYQYSPLQKDEIERQIADMIQAGVVTTSMSPFASPVLLSRKKTAHGVSMLNTVSLMRLRS
jgi:uncharacterized protein (DUF2342 family)